MIHNMVGGGQSDGPIEAGTIVVAYPEGATCTVTNGSDTYTALDTSGAAVFVVEPGAWTVAADSKSQTVTVTAGGWVEVELRFLWLYQRGDQYIGITGGFAQGFANGVQPTITFNDTNIYIKGVGGTGSGSNGSVSTQNAIDVTDYNVLTIKLSQVSFTNDGTTRLKFGLAPAKGSFFGNYSYIAEHLNPANGYLSLDISGVAGSFFVGFGGEGNANKTWSFAVEEIFME